MKIYKLKICELGIYINFSLLKLLFWKIKFWFLIQKTISKTINISKVLTSYRIIHYLSKGKYWK